MWWDEFKLAVYPMVGLAVLLVAVGALLAEAAKEHNAKQVKKKKEHTTINRVAKPRLRRAGWAKAQ